MTSTVSVEISGPIATITFNRPRSLNAITAEGILLYQYHLMAHPYRVRISLDYDAFVNALRNIDTNPAIAVTVWQGKPDAPPLPPFHFDSLLHSDWQVVLCWHRCKSPSW